MRFTSLIVLFVLTLLASGCQGNDSGSEGGGQEDPLRIVVVTHGQASDPFWSVVQNGVRQAGRDLEIDVEYQAPESFDMVTMGQLIDAAVATSPDGLVVSIPDGEALAAPIRGAVDAGIPVVSTNSGDDVSAQLGVLVHVGQPEYDAGYGGGRRLAGQGAMKGLCVNHELGNLSLDLRCDGFQNAFREAGREGEQLAVELTDPTESQQRIQAALRADPDIDAILTLGPAGVLPALNAIRDEDVSDRVSLATFDLSPETLDAIENGGIAFAIDQQQYLQGYLPVLFLALYLRNENTPANDIIRTGPGFVTAENVARLRDLTRAGTR